jgi:parallel beta-helix repeat protein
VRRFLSRKFLTPTVAAQTRQRLRVEDLEDRWCPAVITVDDDRVQNPNANFTTITAALAAANANDVIDVYAGTYTEQVMVSKVGIKLVAVPSNGSDVVIKSPATVAPVATIGAALVDVTATNVKVTGFKIDSTTDTDGNVSVDVRVRGGGSATISNNTVIGPAAPGNPQFGVGIQVGTSKLTGTDGAGTAKVTGNSVSNYFGGGILVDGAGGSATVKNNTVTGRGAANGAVAQYGVQVSRGATSRVEGNTITANTNGNNSGGIYFFQDGGTNSVAAKNTVSGNDIGIWLDTSSATCAHAIQVMNNDVTGNVGYAGIFVQNSDGVSIKNNSVFNNSTFNGIALNGSSSVEVENNSVHNNPNADGIYVLNGGNNQIQCNSSYSNGFNGIFLDHSNNNCVWNNSTWGNAANGINVQGGTGNDIWLGSSTTNVQDGILLQGATYTTIVGNALQSNGGYGLRVLGCDHTLIAFNLITGNGAGSIFVDSASTNTVSIANRTDTPPVVEGTSGSGGTSQAYTCSFAQADTDCSGLED